MNIGVYRRVILLALLTSMQALAMEPMPPEQQTALVQKYCAVCHTDAVKIGGLSLEHYDAAASDPALAAMLLSKLRGGAIGAAGLKHPDQATQDAWFATSAAQARLATRWTLVRNTSIVSASIVRDVEPRIPEGGRPLYRLTISCDTASSLGEVQLTWSPQPQIERSFSVSADGRPGISYTLGKPALASQVLTPLLPERSLAVSNLFDGENVVFRVSDMEPATRRELAVCFARNRK